MRIAQHFSAGIKSRFANECVKRLKLRVSLISAVIEPGLAFQPSASRTESIDRSNPSDKSLGYFHIVRSRGRNARLLFGQSHGIAYLAICQKKKPRIRSAAFLFFLECGGRAKRRRRFGSE